MSYHRMQFDGEVWCGFFHDPDFMKFKAPCEANTALPLEALWPVYILAKQALNVPGVFVECGVDRGGSAKLIAQVANGRPLHLFDTFSGMPETNPEEDLHKAGDFPTPGLEKVKSFVGGENVIFHPGMVPETFEGWSEPIAFAHLDMDLYSSTLDACKVIYPRLSKGGIMVMDDYGRPSCPGARKAIDEYFADKIEIPLPNFGSGQAVVFKL